MLARLITRQTFQNKLLTLLASEDLSRLQPHLRPVTLNEQDRLIEPDRAIPDVHFVESGLLSVVANPGGRDQIEVGMIGREGMSGVPVVLGCDVSPFRVVVRKPGLAYCIPTGLFLEALDESRGLRRTMLRYANVFSIQVGEAARSGACFTIEQRLARWFLMAHDRADGDELTVTHEALALMLGVRRPGVTVATHLLEGEQLIRARRGSVLIRDRAGLEKRAGSSYGVPETEFDRVFRPSRSTSYQAA